MQPVAPVPIAPPRGFPSPNQGPFPHSHDRFPFRGPATIYSPSIAYYGIPSAVPYAVPGPYDDGSASYYDPTASYDPYPVYGARSGDVSTLAPDASSSVIQYPTGRYELRGDGVVAPYQWVWIPNPPPAPPTAPPQSPVMSPPLAAPPAAGPPARHVTVYRWVDGEGVLHFTDTLDAVPQEYRSQAKPPS
jgi:hypothetical protein